MTNRCTILPILLVLSSLASLLATPAIGALEQDEVLLVYNSNSVISSAIKTAYVAAHPNVHVFDLDFQYTTPMDPDNPASSDITPFYIHPTQFLELFGPGSDFYDYLSNNSEIIAIATTREIPALITNDFNISPPTTLTSGRRSLESVLASIPYLNGDPLGTMFGEPNPYLHQEVDFTTFLSKNSTSTLRYLVCRLDSANAGAWTSPPTDSSFIDDIEDLIERSQTIFINKFTVTSFVDDWDVLAPGATGLPGFLDRHRSRGGLFELWRDRWCVSYEGTCEFVHGPEDVLYCVATDGPYSGNYPTLAMFSAGVHHDNNSILVNSPCASCTATVACDSCIASHGGGDYVRHYNPHSAGYFQSLESFNGWTLHDPTSQVSHGQVLEWIAKGGSFAIGHVAEPGSSGTESFEPIVKALYVSGKSWAEAAYSGILRTRWMTTPIGDPLAFVQVLDPDVDRNGIVEKTDVMIVETSIANETLAGDINGDGVSNQEDLDEVLAAYERDCSDLSVLACKHCIGDTNNDCVVNGTDIANVLNAWGDFNATSDQNCDGLVNGTDLAIVLSQSGLIRGDLNGDGVRTPADTTIISSLAGKRYFDSGYNPNADSLCDKYITQPVDTSIHTGWVFSNPPCPQIDVLQ